MRPHQPTLKANPAEVVRWLSSVSKTTPVQPSLEVQWALAMRPDTEERAREVLEQYAEAARETFGEPAEVHSTGEKDRRFFSPYTYALVWRRDDREFFLSLELTRREAFIQTGIRPMARRSA